MGTYFRSYRHSGSLVFQLLMISTKNLSRLFFNSWSHLQPAFISYRKICAKEGYMQTVNNNRRGQDL